MAGALARGQWDGMKKIRLWVGCLLVGAAVGLMGCGSGQGMKDVRQEGSEDASPESGAEQAGGAGDLAGDEAVASQEDALPAGDSAPLTIVMDGDELSGLCDQERFLEEVEAVTGFDLDVQVWDADRYGAMLDDTLAGADWPDILVLDAAKYAEYAYRGVLWDMTDSYRHSAWAGSVRQAEVEKWKLDGKVYGLSPQYANGYVTYVNQSWLDRSGLGLPTTYEEYLALCEAFVDLAAERASGADAAEDAQDVDADADASEAGAAEDAQDADTGAGSSEAGTAEGFQEGTFYAVTGIGYSDGLLYSGCLPELLGGVELGFYQDKDGVWQDGFLAEEARQALIRLEEGYQAGYLDPAFIDNDEAAAFEKFTRGECGLYCAPAGVYASYLKEKLSSNGLDGGITVLPPLEGLGGYREAYPKFWCITTACREPERAFAFLSSMMDAGAGEFVWTYGVEGLHWSDSAGTVLGTDYAEGQFHGLWNHVKRNIPYHMAYLDPLFTLVPLAGERAEAAWAWLGEEAVLSARTFAQNSHPYRLIAYTEELARYGKELDSLKEYFLRQVASGKLTAAECLEAYTSGEGGEWSRKILESLNRRDAQ